MSDQNKLTVVNNTNIQPAGNGLGHGLDFNSKFMVAKPVMVQVVQRNSNVPDDIPKGSLYIKQFQKHFTELRCTLLMLPQELRQCYLGVPGEMNRTPENLICFSTDMVRPHSNAKVPQSMLCSGCSKADWGPFNQHKKETGQKNKALIPACLPDIKLTLLDTTLKMPLRMFLHSTAKAPFEDGMNSIAGMLQMRAAEGKVPNIYDVSFRLSTKTITNGPYTTYVPTFTDPRFITDEEREQFGKVFVNFSRANQQDASTEADDTYVPNTQTVDNSVVEGEYVDDGGEIKI